MKSRTRRYSEKSPCPDSCRRAAWKQRRRRPAPASCRSAVPAWAWRATTRILDNCRWAHRWACRHSRRWVRSLRSPSEPAGDAAGPGSPPTDCSPSFRPKRRAAKGWKERSRPRAHSPEKAHYRKRVHCRGSVRLPCWACLRWKVRSGSKAHSGRRERRSFAQQCQLVPATVNQRPREAGSSGAIGSWRNIAPTTQAAMGNGHDRAIRETLNRLPETGA
jgi:hypothetical protein